MRYNILLAFVFMTFIFCASCSKDILISEEVMVPSDQFEVTIRGEMGDFATGTKASAVSSMRMQWTEGDAVWAYGIVGSNLSLLGKLTVTIENENNYVAVMNGILSSAPSGGKLYLVHSSLNTENQPSLKDNVLTIDMSEQPADIIPFVAYATIDGITESSANNIKAIFHFATSVLKVNVRNLTVDATITSASVSNIETNCVLSFNTSTNSFEISSDGTINSVTKILSDEASQGKVCFYVSVPSFTASTKRVLTITADGEPFYVYNAFPDARAANKYINYVYKAGKGPEGAIIASYAVSENTKVLFSKGNLYYDNSTSLGSFKFETNQYSSEISYNASHVSHFRWVKKTSNLTDDIALSIGNTTDVPRVEDYETAVFFTNDTWTTPREDLTVEGTQGVWRSLSNDEWNYLLNIRKVMVSGESKTPYGEGNVEGINGLILLPDDWDGNVYDASGNVFTYGVSEFSNTFTGETNPTWSAMEEAGCVFLPCAGHRIASDVYYPSDFGYYWSSVISIYLKAYRMNFCSNRLFNENGWTRYGHSLRMVCAVQ